MKVQFVTEDRIVVLHDDHGAFVFCANEGLFIYPPKRPPGPATPEYVTAAMLSWLLCNEDLLMEMHEKFRDYCRQEVTRQQQERS